MRQNLPKAISRRAFVREANSLISKRTFLQTTDGKNIQAVVAMQPQRETTRQYVNYCDSYLELKRQEFYHKAQNQWLKFSCTGQEQNTSLKE